DYAAVEIAYSVTASLAVTAAVPITAGLCVSVSGGRARTPRTRKQQGPKCPPRDTKTQTRASR
ncbi:MAG: hypothetical protein LBD95_07755, partial [Clostridiales Family XIII bacterium]|nr:hypothetical protein [Clostridiales Family XIII bacterium]